MAKQNLLVIGNGFDLTCRLKSSYTDYFNSKFPENLKKSLDSLIPLFETFYFKSVDDNDLNFNVYSLGLEESTLYGVPDGINIWDLIIYYGIKGLPDKWSDVESRILEFLVYNPEIDGPKQNIPNFSQLKGPMQSSDKLFDGKEYSSYFYSQLINFAAAKFKLPNPSNSKGILLSELKKFEDHFTKYLLGLTNDDGSYSFTRNADELLHAIVNQAASSHTSSQAVLSFNYTTPLSSSELANMQMNWRNIHGQLADNNIIFGIDQNKIKVTDVAYQFTKTYRQLIEENGGTDHSNSFLPEKNKIGTIIFYGHSLSEADYSYFQSIFDYYDIYGSEVEITFLYHDYLNDGNNSLQQIQVLSVSELMKKYGQTMGNKDHGENLLHKLIIENRLEIKKIKVPTMIDLT
ncbi:AbiH family protein [Enterococcus gilvus]|uniref:Bacteriophage abortive infection AbiH n=1 Tax=Enterococcus gilvus ATCC BAA-350 TaxID=1158614 RepID=R2VCS6_9ENTE|nr:AbiH family protein [Enterococcus gilvus]EOI55480.1 hypothetical protein UKC_02688 [Enterococcus gilvus ATCC BAA-350]EOW81977.1 hypothetical protein I592_01278 [Enterococcus gilvus ATCC BAA-350]OJG43007.1 hypothetical protein RV02_GL002927 [Enterococcus gilvus]